MDEFRITQTVPFLFARAPMATADRQSLYFIQYNFQSSAQGRVSIIRNSSIDLNSVRTETGSHHLCDLGPSRASDRTVRCGAYRNVLQRAQQDRGVSYAKEGQKIAQPMLRSPTVPSTVTDWILNWLHMKSKSKC